MNFKATSCSDWFVVDLAKRLRVCFFTNNTIPWEEGDLPLHGLSNKGFVLDC